MKEKKYRIVLYYLGLVLIKLVCVLPRRVVLVLGKIFGYLAYAVLSKERYKIIKNLKVAFGDKYSDNELSKIARSVFQNMALTACDFARFPVLTPKDLQRIVKIEGLEMLEQVVHAEKKGAVMLTAHIGNWELYAAAIIALGFSGTVIGKKIYYSKYNDIIISLRNSKNVPTLYRDGSAREILRLLKKGILIGILPDQDIETVDGVFVNFFGKPAYTPVGPVKIALSAKVPILVSYIIRNRGNDYTLYFKKRIDLVQKEHESKQDLINRATKEWSKIIEQCIKEYPEQWAWFHDRWKTRKEDITA